VLMYYERTINERWQWCGPPPEGARVLTPARHPMQFAEVNVMAERQILATLNLRMSNFYMMRGSSGGSQHLAKHAEEACPTMEGIRFITQSGSPQVHFNTTYVAATELDNACRIAATVRQHAGLGSDRAYNVDLLAQQTEPHSNIARIPRTRQTGGYSSPSSGLLAAQIQQTASNLSTPSPLRPVKTPSTGSDSSPRDKLLRGQMSAVHEITAPDTVPSLDGGVPVRDDPTGLLRHHRDSNTMVFPASWIDEPSAPLRVRSRHLDTENRRRHDDHHAGASSALSNNLLLPKLAHDPLIPTFSLSPIESDGEGSGSSSGSEHLDRGRAHDQILSASSSNESVGSSGSGGVLLGESVSTLSMRTAGSTESVETTIWRPVEKKEDEVVEEDKRDTALAPGVIQEA